MAKLSAIQPKDIRSLTIEIGEVEVNLDVDMSAFTIGWQKRFAEEEAKGNISGVAREFFTLVKKWDVTDDKDKVLPLDETTIEALSIKTFGGLVQAITKALDPNELAPKQS